MFLDAAAEMGRKVLVPLPLLPNRINSINNVLTKPDLNNKEGVMRKKILIIVGILIGLTVTFLSAADFKTPHRFKPGDVISADVLNEVFDYIDSSKKTLTSSDLVGAWVCTKYAPNHDFDGVYAPDYNVSDSGLFISMNNVELIVTKDTNGQVKWSSPSRNALAGPTVVTDSSGHPTGRYADECPGNGAIDSIEGDFVFSMNNCLSDIEGHPTWLRKLPVSKVSDSRIKIDLRVNETALTCDLQKIPPSDPLDLGADHTDNNVTLSWADNSSDEEGFKVVRKDSLDGNWIDIAATGANMASYTDNVASKGTYWYRIKSYNNNGSSLGSNVVKITIE